MWDEDAFCRPMGNPYRSPTDLQEVCRCWEKGKELGGLAIMGAIWAGAIVGAWAAITLASNAGIW